MGYRSANPSSTLPAQIVMSAEDLVDAALAGFDLGETVTVPSLPESSDWDTFEASRLVLQPKLSRSVPADRYRVSRGSAQS
jgi:short-subunit dehydrogenase